LRLLALLAVPFAILGCGAVDPAPPADIAAHLIYFRDPRTGVCFAAVGSESHAGYVVTSIATVPCSTLGKKAATP